MGTATHFKSRFFGISGRDARAVPTHLLQTLREPTLDSLAPGGHVERDEERAQRNHPKPEERQKTEHTESD